MTHVNALKRTDMFYDLLPSHLEMISGLCQERNARTGEIIFEENTPGAELYVIVRGEIEVLVDPAFVGGAPARKGSGPVTIATLRDGQTFGEISLVDQGLRSASARCATDNTKLLVIPRDKLLALCTSTPELGYRVMKNIAADLAFKIRNSDLAIREQLFWQPRQAL